MLEFQPKIIAFVCNWCSYAGADKAGGQKLIYSPNIKLIRVMCSGRVSPQFVMAAFRRGADAVAVMGCHFGDCHYRNGNHKTLTRIRLMQKMLPQLGIEAERLQLHWVSAGEAEKFQRVANKMSETIQKLGPLEIPGFVTSNKWIAQE